MRNNQYAITRARSLEHKWNTVLLASQIHLVSNKKVSIKCFRKNDLAELCMFYSLI